jgi:Reverse transcriptase (RNA-dependent DNA polymerase)
MKTLEDYFTKDNIINKISIIRAKLAHKRHDLILAKTISEKAPRPDNFGSELPNIFPPRKKWRRIYRRERAGISGYDRNVISLKKTLKYELKHINNNSDLWVLNLNIFISEVIKSVIDNNFSLLPPSVTPIPKAAGSNEYRTISQYSMKESIVLSLIGNYFRDLYDPIFLSCSFAFRSFNKDMARTPSHHDAFLELYNYRLTHDSKSLFVAECDIAKFFDTIHHSVIRNSLSLINKELSKQGKDVDHRALRIFDNYLDSYTFPRVGLPRATAELRVRGLIDATVPWAEELLSQYYSSPELEAIGIPQGGALSTIIANIVLHKVDKKVLELNDAKLLYIRFCDDIVIAHPDQKMCDNAFSRYLDELKKIKLPAHYPKNVKTHSKSYYKIKTKRVYEWGNTYSRNNIPWVAFVGYQVKYDGTIRIRKSSLDKELTKQRRVTDNIIRHLPPSGSYLKVTRRSVYYRYMFRMISMSVGRVGLNTPADVKRGFCWSEGFKILNDKKISKDQLRKLDAGRRYQIRRLERKLSEYKYPKGRKKTDKNLPEYFGYKFSYYAAFIRQKRRRKW